MIGFADGLTWGVRMLNHGDTPLLYLAPIESAMRTVLASRVALLICDFLKGRSKCCVPMPPFDIAGAHVACIVRKALGRKVVEGRGPVVIRLGKQILRDRDSSHIRQRSLDGIIFINGLNFRHGRRHDVAVLGIGDDRHRSHEVGGAFFETLI